MKVYQGKSKSLIGLGVAIGVLSAGILTILVTIGLRGSAVVLIVLLAFVITLLYKGMVLKITIGKEKLVIYKPLRSKTIHFSDIAFCLIHGIDETDSIVYVFVKKKLAGRVGVKGVKQKLPFEEIVRIINTSPDNIDLDINFNMSEKIPISFVENSEELKKDILTTLGEHQKKILNNIYK